MEFEGIFEARNDAISPLSESSGIPIATRFIHSARKQAQNRLPVIVHSVSCF